MKIVTGYTGEKHITSADDQGFNAGIVGNGLYVLPIGSQFALTYSGTTVTIADGEGVFQGVHFRAESESLTISKPSSGYRCTVIYVRYTKTSGVESVGLYTKDGSAATSESAVVVPTVTSGNIRNGATKAEAVLFRVYSNTSGIYKTEMAADVVSSLASLTSGVSALNSKLDVVAPKVITAISDLSTIQPGEQGYMQFTAAVSPTGQQAYLTVWCTGNAERRGLIAIHTAGTETRLFANAGHATNEVFAWRGWTEMASRS